MPVSPGPSPAWFGVLAFVSFGVLVLSSFASGYHLVGGNAPGAPPAGSGSTENVGSAPVN